MQFRFRWGLAPISASIVVSGCLYLAIGPNDQAFAALPKDVEGEEMVITTRKKEENLMDVPIAVTAFGAEELESAQIRTLDDVAQFTPGLNFFNPIGDFLPVPVIRGMAPTDIFGEGNAAVFVDGVFVAGREGLNFSSLDVERIEINKGPQAALYGRNAFAGAINYVTARPTEEFGMKADVQAGNDGILIGRVAISGPLGTEKLRGRLSYGHNEFDGNYTDPVGGAKVGGAEYDTFQAMLDWDPTDSLGFQLNGFYSEDTIQPNATSSLSANCENTNAGAPIPARLANYCGEIPALGSSTIPKSVGTTGEDRELTRVSLNIDWDLGIGSITSLTGYTNTEQKSITDGNRNLADSLPFVYCTPGFAFPGACNFGPPSRFTSGLLQIAPQPDTTEEISQELRWASEVGRISYDIGGYYFNVESEARELGLVATQPLPADFNAFGPFVAGGLVGIGDGAFLEWFQPGGDVGGGLALKDETTSWSVFGSFSLAFTEKFNGRIEGRYGNEEKERFIVEGDPSGADVNLKDDWDLFSWRLNLDYTFGDNWMVYGSVAQADKPGKFDTNSADVITDSGPPPVTEERLIVLKVDPEKNTTLELGAKGTFWDQRANLRTAVYYTDWEDIVIPQVLENDPTTGLPFEQPESFDLNAGSADIYGIEIESDFILSDNWGFNLGLSYTKSELKNTQMVTYEDFPSFAPDGDVSGNQLLRQPELMGNATLRFDYPAFSDWEVNGRADVLYQDKVYNGNDNQSWYPARTYLNMAFGLTNGRWSLEVWGRNLTEDDSPTGGFRDVYFNNTSDVTQSLPPASNAAADFFPWRFTVTHPRLRTFGATVRWKFGAMAP